MEKKIKARKKLMGEVVSMTSESTAKIKVERKMTHPLYKKIIKSHKYYLVENSLKDIKVGDKVFIEEGRPSSRRKNFNILKKVK